MEIFKGSAVALITPFTKEGNVDYKKLKELIEYQIENKTDAIVICGTTGESATLSEKEHTKLIQECVNQVKGRIPVIAGTGSNDTKTAIELTQEAEKMKVDGLLIVTPYYNKTTQIGLLEHYKAISNKVKTPIILYNVPSRTNLNLQPKTVKQIIENTKNVVAIKEASGNLEQIEALKEIKENINKQFDIYSGNDDQTFDILELGGIGVISVIANILPKETHNLVYDYLKGNKELSKKEQLKMLKLMKTLFIEPNPIPIKYATKLMNMTNGKLRLPLVELEEQHKQELKKEMKNYGIKI
jgi:4-hydroxy-tetrahydrodipicolinate synthase